MVSRHGDTWTMPPWMNPYVHLMGDTEGDSVEALMMEPAPSRTQDAHMVKAERTKAQVELLLALHQAGLLKAHGNQEHEHAKEEVKHEHAKRR